MRNISLLTLCLSLMLWGCKTDKSGDENIEETNNPKKTLSQNKQLVQSIQKAYNTNQFEKEAQVKFNLKLKVEDSLFFDGYVSLKTDASQLRLQTSQMDTVLNTQNLNGEFDKVLFWAAEVYALPFWFDESMFKIEAKNDTIVQSKFNSKVSSSRFQLSTHPMTHIIQKVDYQTNIKIEPFDQGQLYFDRYITVNRIPVAMQWRIEVDGEVKSEAEISRISYPDKF